MRCVLTAMRLMQDGLIGAGPMIGVDMSVSGSKMTRVSHAPNSVEFGELQTSVPVPDMSAPDDVLSSASYSVSGGISNSGWNVFASQELDGTRMGLGYSHAWENAGALGDEIRVVAGSGDDMLDVTWAKMNEARFKAVWGNASLNSVVAKTVAEVNRMLGNDVALGVAAGDVVEDEEEEGVFNNTSSELPEILDINPEIKAADAKYFIVVSYDPGVTKYKDVTKGTNSYEFGRIAHYYNGSAIFNNGTMQIIKDKYGMNPLNEGRPVTQGQIILENGRYISGLECQNATHQQVIIERAIPITKARYEERAEFIKQKIKNPGGYSAGGNDCIDFTNEVLHVVGLGAYSVSDIITHDADSRFTLARAAASLRDNEFKTVPALSVEEVMSRYGVERDRVEFLYINPETQISVFKIITITEKRSK